MLTASYFLIATVLICWCSTVCVSFQPPLPARPRLQQRFATSITGDDDDDDDRSMFFFSDDAINNQEKETDNDDLSKVLDSILKIHCTHSEPDYLMPWQRIAQTTSTSSGFIIHDHKIMTNAHSVEYGSIVQVQRRGEERKYECSIDVFCNECDLAVLTVNDDEFWSNSDLVPLEFGALPKLQDSVEVLGYPTGGDSLSITKGVVSRIEMQEYTQSSSYLLAIQIDAAINAGNSGGPVVNKDLQVIGVAFQGLDGAENIGYVVPVTVVQHILKDVRRNGKYTGFCSLGVGLAMLENKAFRKSLHMTEKCSGVMVKGLHPMSAAKDILLPNDVVMSVDQISVGNDGKIPFRRGERVALACYIQTKIVGDTVAVHVLRDGQEMDINVPVSITRTLVPTHWVNRPPPYLVLGGLVFTALSVPYLYACGVWDDFISSNMSYLMGMVNKPLEEEMDQYVMLIQVLAHSDNLGYDRLNDLHLQKMNGQKVRSLVQLQTLIEDCEDDFLRLEFSPGNHIVVMERATLDTVTGEVCEEHSIRRPWYFHEDSSSDNADGEEGEEDEETSATNGETEIEGTDKEFAES